MSEFINEQLQLDGMEQFGVPEEWEPTIEVEVIGIPRTRMYRVSSSGQLSIPAETRRRWGIDEGGEVNVFDCEGAVFIFPTQIHPDTARELIHQMLSPVASENPRPYTQKLSFRGILGEIKSEFDD